MVRFYIAALVAASIFGASAKPLSSRDDSLTSRIEQQNVISLQGVFNNLGPNGMKAPGAFAGAFIASPSKEDPDYYFTWIRDSALVTKMVIDEFLQGRKEYRTVIQDYLQSQAILQTVTNPSGALLSSGRGLGEPKFNVNLTRFDGPWGRPQRDGPALRATALITYARWLLSTGDDSDANEVKEKVWPVVQNDLNFVAQYWNSTGFDLWEENSGSSFFTTAVQHRALVEGTALGKTLGNDTTNYESQAPNVLCFLQTYWNGQYAIGNINTATVRTGIDANTVLTSIATFDPASKCDDSTFQPCSSRALSNLKAYVDSFRTIYTINRNASSTSAVATGRYSEDVYYGGNPWYLTTLAVAEQLYDAVQQWKTIGSINITDLDLPFWKMAYPSATTGTYRNQNSTDFNNLLNGVLAYADDYVNVFFKYLPADGSLAEQYSRENGTAVSARDLTWSYASFVTMRAARLSATTNHTQVPSWGASTANTPPSICIASSAPGTYTPAVGAGAPPASGDCTILVTFNVNASTFYGENIYLSGDSAELGNWSPADAVPGNAGGYTSERPLWSFDVEMATNSTVSYGYLRNEPDGMWLYETRNRTLNVPACGEKGDLTVEDAWVGPVGTPPLIAA